MLKPELKGKIAYFRPDSTHYIEDNAKKDALGMRQFIANLKASEVKAVIFSFKAASDIENSSLIHFLKLLSDIERSLDIVVGISDYHPKLYPRVFEKAKKLSISMFITSDVAEYILGERNLPAGAKVSVLVEDELEGELLKIEIESKGQKFLPYSDDTLFYKEKESDKSSLFIYKSYFDFLHNKTVARIEGGVVYFELQERLGKKISTVFPQALYAKRLKEGFKLFVMDASEVKSVDPKATDYFISLSFASRKFGAQIVFIHLANNLIQKIVQESMKKSHILFFESSKEMFVNPEIKSLLSKKADTKSGELNKALIGKLPILIEATVGTFRSFLGGEPVKVSHKISAYEDTFMGKDPYLTSSMEFKGEIEGSLMVMLGKVLIDKISEAILGEVPGSVDESLDVVKEFVNIISGQSKTLLSQNDVAVSIAIPKAFAKKNEAMAYIKDKKGVLVNMRYENYPLQIFLIP